MAVCGDITDGFIQEQVNIASAKLIISTVPDFRDNLSLLHFIKAATVGKRIKPKLIFIAQDEAEPKFCTKKYRLRYFPALYGRVA